MADDGHGSVPTAENDGARSRRGMTSERPLYHRADLARLIDPRSIAIIGVSASPGGFGSRTNTTSVVSRGLYINSSMLCLVRPAEPPAAVKDKVTAQLMDATTTERQKSDFRTTTSPCNGCHTGFDPYGLSLENYDAIGRYRTTYAGNVPIDATATLPEAAGGAHIQNGVELESNATTWPSAWCARTRRTIAGCRYWRTMSRYQSRQCSATASSLLPRIHPLELAAARSMSSNPSL